MALEDRGEGVVRPGAPVPVSVPGDFTVRLRDVMPGWVMEGLKEVEVGEDDLRDTEEYTDDDLVEDEEKVED